MGLKWCILGHSERRHTPEIKESDEYIAHKAHVALTKGLDVMYCIGERLEEREGNKTNDVLTV